MNESESFDLTKFGIVAAMGVTATWLVTSAAGTGPRVEFLAGVGMLMTGLAAFAAGSMPAATAEPLSEVIAGIGTRKARPILPLEFDRATRWPELPSCDRLARLGLGGRFGRNPRPDGGGPRRP